MKAKKQNVNVREMRVDSLLFATGAGGYALLELLWRGYTHWSMALAGGICFTLFSRLWEHLKRLPRIYIPIVGGGIITAVEFCFGIIFNLMFKKRIWDYSHLPFQFLGQVCVLFSTLWGILSLVAFPLAGRMRRQLSQNKQQ